MTDDRYVEEVQPDPAALIESMRAFGYSLPTAVADLVDNSIAAGGRRIEVRLDWAGSDSTVAIVDDGAGMDEARLIAAMRLGSRSAAEERAPGDLGRFGLGLKSAAWSQARVLTVITRERAQPVRLRRWDLDHIVRTRRWELGSRGSAAAETLATELEGQAQGTIVLLERPDRLVGDHDVDDERARKRFFAGVERVARHLGVVFHRFLGGRGGLKLFVNGLEVRAWDPFLEGHAATQPLPEETLWQAGHAVVVSPFVLPHHSRLTQEAHAAAAGAEGWNAQQGFYVYRARRLLVSGGWLGLPNMQREEHNKLARVRIDIENAVDTLWQIDVRKARARIPGPLQPDLLRIARAARARAANVYRFRGKQAARQPGQGAAVNFVWQPHLVRGGQVFRINREHPVLAALRETSPEVARAVGTTLRLVEEHLPVEAIALGLSERPGETPPPPYGDDDREVARLLRATVDAMAGAGASRLAALDAVALAEPFGAFPELVQVLREELQS